MRWGGWVAPLKCDNPILAEWLSHLKVACSILGIPCDTDIEPALGICPQNWTALGIFVTVCGLAVVLVTITCLLIQQLVRWMRSRKSGTMAAMAGTAARKLHKVNPTLYPIVQHSWYKLPEEQLKVPCLCAECFETLQPDIDGKRVQCCEVCGVLCHEGCCRKLPQDCRPVAEVGNQMMHLWKPAGCVLYEGEETWQSDTQHYCLYCSGPCEADIFAQEPIWSCAWCQVVAHVRCFRDFHALYSKPNKESGNTTLQRKQVPKPLGNGEENDECCSSEGIGLEDKDALAGRNFKHKSGGQLSAFKVPSFDLGDIDPFAAPKRKKRGRRKGKQKKRGNEIGFKPKNGNVQSLEESLGKVPINGLHNRGKSGSGLGSFIDLFGAAISIGSSDDDYLDEKVHAENRRTPGMCDLETLDTCTFGPHKALVLPPTAVKVLPSHTWSEKAKELLGRRSSISGKSTGTGRADSLTAEVKGGAQKIANWWGEAHIPWSSYKIEALPTDCRPLLVFLNMKSGPQSGTILRRKLLRLLNPLQVVELPKEKPDEALQLFADIPNLQILVMGGDGTAGWILGCLDQIQEARANSEEKQAWSPPPVAVIPMGTGNDLARCLGWGGGLHAIMQKGMQYLLQDIQKNAIVGLLDRWNVHIIPSEPPSSPSKAKLKIMGGFSQEPQKEIKKAMNNYLGVGVDARASLDFHALRNSYPKWFRSQMGNKLWYTTVGAKDMIGRTSKGLAKNLQVVCDGNILPLPEDIEGLLVLNINSYMGGTDMWSSGASWQDIYEPPVKQSICDGKLELVAVYGSWHLGQLQVGLSGAIRLTQCSSVKITAKKEVPIQIDGEPWMQPPATLEVSLKMKAFMLRKAESGPLSRMAKAVADALDESSNTGLITNAQKRALTERIASRLHNVS